MKLNLKKQQPIDNKRMFVARDTMVYARSRQTTTRKVCSTILFIAVALIISFLILPVSGKSISDSFSTMSYVFTQSGDQLIIYSSILGLAALAFLFSFKLGLFNIGISGQMMMSGLLIYLTAHSFYVSGNIPSDSTALFISILVGILGGMAVSMISGILKIFFNISEVITSIMFNWIIVFFVQYAIFVWIPQEDVTNVLQNSYDLPLAFSLAGEDKWTGAINSVIIVLVVAVAVWALFKFTVFGKKIVASGLSISGANYAGYNTKKLQLSSFAITGMISGLLGLVVYTAFNTSLHMLYSGVSANVPVEGFNGIAISLIALNNPIAVLPIALLLGFLQTASTIGAYSASFYNLILSIVMYGAAIFSLALYFKPWIWFISFLRGRQNQQHYYDFNNDIILALNALKKKKYDGKAEIKNAVNKAKQDGKNKRLEIKNNLNLNVKALMDAKASNEEIAKLKDQAKKDLLKIKQETTTQIALIKEKMRQEYKTSIDKGYDNYVISRGNVLESYHSKLIKTNIDTYLDFSVIKKRLYDKKQNRVLLKCSNKIVTINLKKDDINYFVEKNPINKTNNFIKLWISLNRDTEWWVKSKLLRALFPSKANLSLSETIKVNLMKKLAKLEKQKKTDEIKLCKSKLDYLNKAIEDKVFEFHNLPIIFAKINDKEILKKDIIKAYFIKAKNNSIKLQTVKLFGDTPKLEERVQYLIGDVQNTLNKEILLRDKQRDDKIYKMYNSISNIMKQKYISKSAVKEEKIIKQIKLLLDNETQQVNYQYLEEIKSKNKRGAKNG